MIDRGTVKLGFIGAGQMATALSEGFLRAGAATPDRLAACDVLSTSAERFRERTGATIVPSAAALADWADVIFLAVKPQHMAAVLTEISPRTTTHKLFVSIAAGITLRQLTEQLGHDRRVIRVMPNTPCLVGEGASGYALSGTATEADGDYVRSLLATVGTAVPVPEKLLDAVTGLSGSGPAYGYLIIEALSDGGVRMGLPRDVATKLAAQTLLGAAKMVLTTGQHPGALKDAVTSPGGTTIAGLHALEQGGLRGILMDAIQSATERAQELGR